MARGTTFGQIIEDTILEAGLDPDPALSLNVRPLIKRLIKREYERLYEEYDWPFLRVREALTTSAGQRYYDIPTALNLERIEAFDYYWGDVWIPLCRGISVDDYTAHDSDRDERFEPAVKWDIHFTDPTAQIELWPMPVSDGKEVRVTGIRKLTPLIADDSRCDLDDMMIVLFAASEYLARNGGQEAPLKQQKAVARFHLMKGKSTTTRTNAFSFGQSPEQGRRYPTDVQVAYVDRTNV